MDRWSKKWEQVHREQAELRMAQLAIDKAARKEAWWAEQARRQSDSQPESD